MIMHNPVQQEKKLSAKNFDFMNQSLNKFTEYLKDVKDNPFSNRLDLEYLAIKPLERLKNILPDEFTEKLFKASSYKCPFNGYRHYSLIPVSILTEDPLYYIKLFHDVQDNVRSLPWYTNMACDPTWNKDDAITDYQQFFTSVIRASLGSGYTEMFYPNDGGYGFGTVGIELDNGDIVLFVIMKWYNK